MKIEKERDKSRSFDTEEVFAKDTSKVQYQW